MAKRKNYSADEKVKLLREHLVDKVAVSEVCERTGLNPNVFYTWQKQFFENGAAAFTKETKSRKVAYDKQLERKISQLETRIVHKDGVIAEIMESHIMLKKSLGED